MMHAKSIERDKRQEVIGADDDTAGEPDKITPVLELMKATKDPRLGLVFSDLIDAMDIAIWELDKDYRVVAFNKKAEKIYGAGIIGRFCYAIAAKLDHICPDCPAQKVYQGLPSGRSEHRRVKVTGEVIYIDHIATPIRDKDGNVTGSLVLIIDITDRKRMEKELKQHRDKLEDLVEERTRALRLGEERYRNLYNESKKAEAVYRSLIHSSADAIVMYDLDGNAQYVSPVFTQLFGWTLDEVKGKRIPFMPDSERELSMWHIRNVLENGLLCQGFETKRLTKDGKLLDVSVSASMFTDHEGKPAGMLVILRDISERRVMEARVRQSQKMEAIGALAGGIAHDFNNILSIILGNADLAMSFLPKGLHVRQFIEGIRTASLRARDVIRQLLSFSSKSEETRHVICITPIVKESMNLLRSSIPVNIEFRSNICSAPRSILAEPTQIHQILINLCTNAAHAMSDKGGVLEIVLENADVPPEGIESIPELAPGEFLKLSVRDQGGGIPPENLERIFEPYFTTKEFGKGTGMGLAVVHGIVKSHDALIKVDSRPGKGASFDIYFPAIESPAEPSVVPENPYPKGTESILLVDDDHSILHVEEQILTLLGYSVTSFSDPEKALSAFERSPDRYDLVMADMTMPKMYGDEFLRQVLETSPETPTVLCTGYSENIDEKSAAKLGIDTFLMKPVKLEKLAFSIRQLLDKTK